MGPSSYFFLAAPPPSYTHTQMQSTHTLIHSGCTAGSISSSKRQTTLICICEMGFHPLILTYHCSRCGGVHTHALAHAPGGMRVLQNPKKQPSSHLGVESDAQSLTHFILSGTLASTSAMKQRGQLSVRRNRRGGEKAAFSDMCVCVIVFVAR